MTNPIWCNIVAFTSILSRPFFVLSVSFLNVALGRSPRLALYVPSETLVLLCLVFMCRYRYLFANFFSLAHFQEKVDLFGLLMATALTIHYQNKARLPNFAANPSTNSITASPLINLEDEKAADEAQVEAETSTATAGNAAAPSQQQPKKTNELRFSWRRFTNVIFWSSIPTLYTGQHSVLSRLMNHFYAKPNASFWSDMEYQLIYLLILLEINAVLMLYTRVMVLRRAQLSEPPADLESTANIDKEEYRRRIKIPKPVWGFIWCSQLSAAFALPCWITQVVQAEKEVDDTVIFGLVGCLMKVVFFVAFLAMYRWMRAGKVESATEQTEGGKNVSLIEV
ncbi:uncharacterized protein UTRI_10452_B [Ustilago trichophora]|uniref:Uncharacterized protein n=1 Tax=Ustilago trichophora TaxID=86804 RepID=A0A5C3ECV2_9BASI|nr:uncharacterized protein UTRI_10452_B [Ustilago trichophora]